MLAVGRYVALFAFASVLGLPQRSTSAGLQLLHVMQDALGGADKIAAVRDFEETIRAEAWDASGASLGEVRKRTRWIRTPGLLRLDQIGPRGTYALFFDGRSGWPAANWHSRKDTSPGSSCACGSRIRCPVTW
jgi:hypothetical protein